MRKFGVWFSISAVVFIGIWTYCCLGAPAPVGDVARKATRDAALAMGVHVFDPATDVSGKTLDVSSLPEGYYLYVGGQPLQQAPKWVSVNAGHTISWLKSGETMPVVNVQEASTRLASSESQPSESDQWEEYSYPKVKWKAKRLPEGGESAAQLWTTYDRSGEQPCIKFQLRLLKPAHVTARTVELLDADGFKLYSFDVPVSEFHMEGSDIITARNSFPFDEEAYRRIRDYSVD